MAHTDGPPLQWEDDGSGPPVLMVMGLGMRGAVWRPQVRGLRDHHRVLTFDHRGLGGSAPLEGSWTLVDGATDALRVLDAAGEEQAHVVGVSMGGMIVQELALRWPERVRTLTLVATSPGGPLHWVPPIRSLPNLLRTSRATTAEDRHRVLERLLFPPGGLDHLPPAQLDQRMHDVGAAPDPEVLRAQVRAVRRHDARRRLPNLAMPTLVVQPGRDRMIRPRRSERIARLVPDARLVRLPDAGHGVTFQQADALNALLLEHFATAR